MGLLSTRRRRWALWLVLPAIGAISLGTIAYRANRLYDVSRDWKTEVRYLIEQGGTIGQAPAAQTFSGSYLDAVFGENPNLLDQLKNIISRSLTDDPNLNLGEVAAMVVTYRQNGDAKVRDVVAHVAGGFALGQRKPGFHRDGFFAHQLDRHLWQAGNSMLGFVGRDMLLLADEDVRNRHNEIFESVLSGEVMPLADSLHDPLHFIAVFPSPDRIVPPQLRRHIQAFIVKGYLSREKGSIEIIFLAKSPQAANYSLSVIEDLRKTSLVFLRAKWSGVVRETAWGPLIDPWWAFEMANSMESSTLEKQDNIVSIKTSFERVMVNAALKSLERMGRDMSQMKGSLEERLDPRLVDARMQTRSPLHYWSNDHEWGPDWPIGPPTNAVPVHGTEGEAAPAEPVAPAVSQPL